MIIDQIKAELRPIFYLKTGIKSINRIEGEGRAAGVYVIMLSDEKR